jgi:hypothetical protein
MTTAGLAGDTAKGNKKQGMNTPNRIEMIALRFLFTVPVMFSFTFQDCVDGSSADCSAFTKCSFGVEYRSFKSCKALLLASTMRNFRFNSFLSPWAAGWLLV